MTCLVSSAAPQPDDRNQRQPQAGGLAIAMVGTAMDQLRSYWCGLGFDGAVFLEGEELQSSLAALRPAQRRELLITILGLCEDTRLCQELQKAIQRGLIDPGAGRSLVRLVAMLQPVLAVQLPQLLSFGQSRTIAPSSAEPAVELQLDIALLGLSIRMDNTMRRNGLQRISDLIGLEEPQLLRLRGLGANGLLGAPGLMPLQTQLPASVKGAVQRHGGQSGVAKQVGLQYQGQLTGESGGRTYWTERRLIELLEQTVAHSGLVADAMPSKQQITAFLASGVVPEYLDKQPNSVFAALRCQYTLSWQQVAERFGRVWQG